MAVVDFTTFQKNANYRGFRGEDWKILSSYVEIALFKAKEKVFEENDLGDGFFWIHKGKIRISRQVKADNQQKTQEHLLSVLSEGSIFGEMALIDSAKRSADALAEVETELYFLSYDNYHHLCVKHPGTALAIQDLLVRTLCARLREANRNFETIYFWCS